MAVPLVPYPFAAGETIDRERVLENFREMERATHHTDAAQFASANMAIAALVEDASVFPVHVPLIAREVSFGGIVQGFGFRETDGFNFFAGVALLADWRLVGFTVSIESADGFGTTFTVTDDGVATAAAIVYADGDAITAPLEYDFGGNPITFAEGSVIRVSVSAPGAPIGYIQGAMATLWFRVQLES